MDFISVVILAVIQGIAEFLPISSSAHLIIFRDIFNIAKTTNININFIFDIALHLGTLLAIIIYFFKDFIKIIKNGIIKGIKDEEGKIMWYLIIATIPAAIIGILFEDIIEKIIRNNYLVIIIALIIMGLIIYYIDKNSKSIKTIKNITVKDALIIGCSQILALIPGFSRSGTTITAARYLGIKKDDAAKFSFYLTVPIVSGAVLLKILDKEAWTIIFSNLFSFVFGIIITAIIGILCIKYLLQYLHNHNFKIFMIYRIILAIIVIVYLFIM